MKWILNIAIKFNCFAAWDADGLWFIRHRLTDGKHSMILVYKKKEKGICFLNEQSERLVSFIPSYMCSHRSKSHRSCSQKPSAPFSLALTEDLLSWDSVAITLITINGPKCALHLHCPLRKGNCHQKGVITPNVTHRKAAWGSPVTHPIEKHSESTSSSFLHTLCNTCSPVYSL